MFILYPLKQRSLLCTLSLYSSAPDTYSIYCVDHMITTLAHHNCAVSVSLYFPLQVSISAFYLSHFLCFHLFIVPHSPLPPFTILYSFLTTLFFSFCLVFSFLNLFRFLHFSIHVSLLQSFLWLSFASATKLKSID